MLYPLSFLVFPYIAILLFYILGESINESLVQKAATMNRETKLLAIFFIVAGLVSLAGGINIPVLAAHDADNPGESDNAEEGLKNADQRLHESGPDGGAARDDKFHEGANNAGFTCQGFFDNPEPACGGIE
jgi:hypothetical protein